MQMMSRNLGRIPTSCLKVTRVDIYKLLISLHKWTFEEIASLNRWQQAIAADVEASDYSDTLEFRNEEDYLRWKAGQ